MIEYLKGDLLSSDAEALVNTVNTVGIMGKGIALQFKNRYPTNYKIYQEACKKGTLKPGQVLLVKDGDLMNSKIIINFPTKVHWKGNSKYEYIISGLKALKQTIINNNIKSIALPPLGCGNGGLEWDKVKGIIESSLKDVQAKIFVYQPNEEIKAILQNEKSTKEAKLTPARAMLLYLLFQYEKQGEQSSLFIANKLAYFLQRRGENLRLKFEAHHYGPYSVQLNHVLLYLNGVYLKGMEQNTNKPFDPIYLNYDKLNEIRTYIDNELKPEQYQRIKDVLELISRFESTFALELLSSVDYIISTDRISDFDEIADRLGNWSKRKHELFEKEHIKVAYNHLRNYAENPFVNAN